MGFPWWVALAFAFAALGMVILNFRFFRRLWQRYRDGSIDPNDEWDPFA